MHFSLRRDPISPNAMSTVWKRLQGINQASIDRAMVLLLFKPTAKIADLPSNPGDLDGHWRRSYLTVYANVVSSKLKAYIRLKYPIAFVFFRIIQLLSHHRIIA